MVSSPILTVSCKQERIWIWPLCFILQIKNWEPSWVICVACPINFASSKLILLSSMATIQLRGNVIQDSSHQRDCWWRTVEVFRCFSYFYLLTSKDVIQRFCGLIQLDLSLLHVCLIHNRLYLSKVFSQTSLHCALLSVLLVS